MSATRFSIAAGLLIAALGAALALSTSAAGAPSITQVTGYDLPASLGGGQFILEPATGAAPIVTQDEAVSLALKYAGPLAAEPTGASAQYVVFTDTKRANADSVGDLNSLSFAFDHVPAWFVRFTGVPQPVFGGYGTGGGGVVAQELNVVLDAATGEYLEMFSFQ